MSVEVIKLCTLKGASNVTNVGVVSVAKKYSIPVTITTTASKMIGTVECDSLVEYKELSEKLWEEQDYYHPTTNISNDFDLDEWDFFDVHQTDLKYHTNDK